MSRQIFADTPRYHQFRILKGKMSPASGATAVGAPPRRFECRTENVHPKSRRADPIGADPEIFGGMGPAKSHPGIFGESPLRARWCGLRSKSDSRLLFGRQAWV